MTFPAMGVCVLSESQPDLKVVNREHREASAPGQAGTIRAPSRGADTSFRIPEEAYTSSPSSVTFFGWRVWRIKQGRLLSLASDVEWHPKVAVVAGWKRPPLRLMLFLLAVSILPPWAYVEAFTSSLSLWLKISMGLVSPVVLMFVLIAGFGVTKGLFYTIKGALGSLFNRVVVGNGTPGIFAYYHMGRVDEVLKAGGWYARRSDTVLVRGTVELWGDTIEHEWGVKGEYAYPKTIDAVCCVRCLRWMPIENYRFEADPPMHEDCGESAGRPLPKKWSPAGVHALRSSIPEWFKVEWP